VKELIQELKRLNRLSRAVDRPQVVNALSQASWGRSPDAAESPIHLTLRFLRVIRDQPDGVTVRGVMEALRVSNPKAIGGRSVSVNRTLGDIGLKPSDVYTNVDTQRGRIWKAGAQLPRALAELQRLLAGGPA
jgi:hypothetical protein